MCNAWIHTSSIYLVNYGGKLIGHESSIRVVNNGGKSAIVIKKYDNLLSLGGFDDFIERFKC